MMTTNQKMRAMLLSAVVFAVPLVVWAQVGIPCGETPFVQGSNPAVTATHPCEFDDVIRLINNIIRFLMIDVAVPLAALGIMWSGGKLIFNQNKEGAWNEAKEGFWNIAKGFLIMLGAYLLIKTVIFAFLNDKDTALMSLVQFMFQ